MKKLDSNNNSNAATRRSTTRRTATTARRSASTARRSGTTRRASASKKGSGYNKYVPVFIDNYAEQRSAKLRAKLGWQAYGIYLAILQRLRSEKDCTLELDYESLALSFWTDEDNLRAIIEDFNLFAINRQEGTFYSPLLDSMLSTLDPSLAQSRLPLCPETEDEEEGSVVDEAEDCTEDDVCECSSDECEMTEENDDFSDENLSVSDENSDVMEKEFRVKEKEIEIFSPFFSEDPATRRVADEVSIFASEEAQKRIPQDAKTMQKMQNLMPKMKQKTTLKMMQKTHYLMPKMMQNLMQKTVQKVMQKVCCKCAQMWCKTMRCKVMQMNTLTRFLTRA